ncbi:cytochrome P450 [Kitasatospora sp. NPDC002040]|uniref:cytochrome P450 n=1 Tax=Kitasatospora sp. NPDC002040 TaxID=3154661 RepID=UPI00333160B4
MSFLVAYDAVPRTDPAQQIAVLRQHLATDRPGVFRELRSGRPVFSTPAGVFVTRYADVVELLSLPEVFTVGAHRPALEDVLGAPHILSRDGADVHWRERGYAQLVLAAEDAPRVRALAARISAEVLERARTEAGLRGDKTFDLVQDYTSLVAARLAVEYLGFTGVDPRALHTLSRRAQWAAFVNPFHDPQVHASGVEAGRELHDLVADVIERRRAAGLGPDDGPDDVLGRMLRTAPAELGFDDERVNANLVGFLIGYQQNAAQCGATALKELALRPEVLAQAVRAAADPDPAVLDEYVWEALRFHPFVPSTARLTVREHVLAAGAPRETVLPSGSLVHACLASAMFDQDVVKDPEAFRTGRPAEHNLVLSRGAHDCVGKYSARVILPELVRQVLLRPEVRPLPGEENAMDYAGMPYPQHYQVAVGQTAGPKD